MFNNLASNYWLVVPGWESDVAENIFSLFRQVSSPTQLLLPASHSFLIRSLGGPVSTTSLTLPVDLFLHCRSQLRDEGFAPGSFSCSLSFLLKQPGGTAPLTFSSPSSGLCTEQQSVLDNGSKKRTTQEGFFTLSESPPLQLMHFLQFPCFPALFYSLSRYVAFSSQELSFKLFSLSLSLSVFFPHFFLTCSSLFHFPSIFSLVLSFFSVWILEG